MSKTLKPIALIATALLLSAWIRGEHRTLVNLTDNSAVILTTPFGNLTQ